MTWTLPSCKTNDTVWNPRWEQTRGLDCYARAGSVIAINAHGTVKLFDASDRHAVVPRGEVALPKSKLALPEEYPLCFRGEQILQASPDALYEIDASLQVVATHRLEPQLRPGTFIDGVLYAASYSEPGLFVVRPGAKPARFAAERSQYSAPATFAKLGNFLYAIGTSELDVFALDAEGMPSAEPVASKKINTAASAETALVGDLLVVVSDIDGSGVQVVDVAKPKAPKVQKRPFKPEPRGWGMSGETLLVVDGPYQKHLSLTRIALARPASTASKPERLTTDPELACGLLLLEEHGDELFALVNTGRFVVLARD